MKQHDFITILHTITPCDLDAIIHLHGALYAQEYGFDATFKAYVAEPLRHFAQTQTAQEKIWIVKQNNLVRGSVAVVHTGWKTAQLRWFLIHPSLRGKGLGTTLLKEAVQFAEEQQYQSIFLWTVSILTTANKLYTNAGFQCTEEKAQILWGKPLIEQRFELFLK